jgi:hypothetical protein
VRYVERETKERGMGDGKAGKRRCKKEEKG